MGDAVDALERLIALLFTWLGPGGAVAVLLGVLVLGVGFRFYQDRRADRFINKALEEKERTIQRLAKQEREWRMVFFERLGMPRNEVERMVLRNEADTPQDARRELEDS